MIKKIIKIKMLLIIIGLVGLGSALYVSKKYTGIIDSQNKKAIEEMKRIEKIEREILKEYLLRKNQKVYPKLAEEIIIYFEEASMEFDLPKEILFFVADVESDFDIYAKSKANAVGILQINHKVWAPILIEKKIIKSTRDLWDPKNNIRAGAYILKQFINEGENLLKENKLTAYKFHTPIEYGLAKYFGGNSKKYVEKVKIAIGDYWVTIQTIKNLKSKGV